METGTIYIQGIIGADTTLVDVVRQVKSLEEVDDINVHITSAGGNVMQGFAIYDYLIDLPQNVNTYASGNCDSIATVIFQAGNTRYIEEGINSFVIHNANIDPSVLGRSVDSNQLNEIANELKQVENNITQFYTKKTSISFQTLDKLMDAETNLSAKDAVALGFADKTFSKVSNLAAALVVSNESYNDYPQAASDNAKRALKWLEENDNPNNCLTAVGFARANQLANRESISEETISRMSAFERHRQNKDVDYSEGCGGIAWDAWGGDEGIAWAQRKLEQIRNTNKTIDNMNPILKAINELKDLVTKKSSNMIELTLEDGTRVYVDSDDGELEGKRILLMNEDGQVTDTPAPDGNHRLRDGRTISVEDGLVTGVREDADAMEESEDGYTEEETQNLNNMTPDEVKALVSDTVAQAMKEMEENILSKMTDQSNILAENKKVLDREYADLKAAMQNVVTQFEVPTSKGAFNEASNTASDAVTRESLAAVRKQLRSAKN